MAYCSALFIMSALMLRCSLVYLVVKFLLTSLLIIFWCDTNKMVMLFFGMSKLYILEETAARLYTHNPITTDPQHILCSKAQRLFQYVKSKNKTVKSLHHIEVVYDHTELAYMANYSLKEVCRSYLFFDSISLKIA